MSSSLELRAISKAFPGVQALSDVTLSVHPGEIHALMGENGAGKSTLMKIASGWYQPDDGEIRLDGQPMVLKTPAAAQAHEIITVYQELSVLPNLDVGRNIMIGRLPKRSVLWIERSETERQAGQVLQELGIDLDPSTPIDELSIGQQQMVEIARAVSHRPRFLILDEPTSSLGKHEEEQLLRIVRQLKDDGVGIVYISHRMNEVFALADRITVLRDGKLVATKPTDEFTRDSLISAMVGRQVEARTYVSDVPHSDPVLTAEDVHYGSRVTGASLRLYQGEVLGLAGLMGSGRTELASILAGLLHADSGSMTFNGEPYSPTTVKQAMRQGVSYVSEDRKNEGLLLTMSVSDNINLPTLWMNSVMGLLRRSRLRHQAVSWIERLNVKTPNQDVSVNLLSGGNQQKVALAKCLSTNPKVVLLDEPTRGVDVGAKAEIHDLIRELAKEGAAVLVVSSDLPEILAVSDRIAVMSQGSISGELPALDATEESVLQLAFDGADAT